MFPQVTFSEIIPFKAVLFQFLFLLVAISIKAFIFHRMLQLDYKISAQYSVTVNLLSTCVGWVMFFIAQPWIPEGLRIQLISYFFFEQFFQNSWLDSILPLLTVLSLGIFLGTFLIELRGLELLEIVLEKKELQPKAEEPKSTRFRRNKNQGLNFHYNDRAYAVLVANACSFSAILFLLMVRWVEQTYYLNQ